MVERDKAAEEQARQQEAERIRVARKRHEADIAAERAREKRAENDRQERLRHKRGK